MADPILRGRLTLDDNQFQQILRRSSEAAQQAASKTGSAWSRIMEFASGGLIASAAAAAAGALAKFGTAGIKSAAEMEQTNIAFETLLGSADKAKKVIADLQQLGAETPFEFPELADAGRKLVAFGTDARLVVPTLRMIGDVASGIQQPIGEIADIYGKAKVQGRLFAEDINQLTGRGIPIMGELAKQFGVTEAEVRKLVESGRVNFGNLENAFISLTSKGGAFFGMMQKQSTTAIGMFSTLMDNIGQVQRAFSAPILEAFKPALDKLINVVPQLMEGAERWGKKLAAGIGKALELFDRITGSTDPFQYVVLSLKIGLLSVLDFFKSKLADVIDTIAPALAKLGGPLAAMMGVDFKGAATTLGGVATSLRAASTGLASLIQQRDNLGKKDAGSSLGVDGRESIFKSKGIEFKSKGPQFQSSGPQFGNVFSETAGGVLDAPRGGTRAIDRGWGTGGLQTSGLLTGRTADIAAAQKRDAAMRQQKSADQRKELATESTMDKISQTLGRWDGGGG